MRQYSISSDSPLHVARHILDRACFAEAPLFMESAENGARESPPVRSPPARSTGRLLRNGCENALLANVVLRLGGLALISIAAAAIRWLFVRVHADAHHLATAFDYLLALTGFTGASVGSVCLCLGTHVVDEIEVSERWRRRR